MEIVLQLKPVKSIRDMVSKATGKRKVGLLYFQILKPGIIIPRVISEATDAKWLEQQILSYRIFLPVEHTVAEPS